LFDNKICAQPNSIFTASKVLQVLNDGVPEDFVLKAQQSALLALLFLFIIIQSYLNVVLAQDTLTELKKKVMQLEDDEWMFAKLE
jgi:hypothetical protein